MVNIHITEEDARFLLGAVQGAVATSAKSPGKYPKHAILERLASEIEDAIDEAEFYKSNQCYSEGA